MKSATCLIVMMVLGGGMVLAADRSAVLVLPFEGASADVGWVGKAVQQTVVAELSAVGTLSAVSRRQGVGSPDDAVSAAREAGAKYVVFGGVQGTDGRLRVTGAVMEVAGWRAAGVIQATGAARDVFTLQDDVATQVKSALSVGGEAAPEIEPVRTPATTSRVGPTAAHTQRSGGYLTRVERDIARIDQGTDRLRALEDEIDRLKDRIRDLERDDDLPRVPMYGPRYDDDFYDPYPYFRYSYFSPAVYYLPIHGNKHPHIRHHHGHRHFGSGLKVQGSFRSGNFGGTFRLGGGGRRR